MAFVKKGTVLKIKSLEKFKSEPSIWNERANVPMRNNVMVNSKMLMYGTVEVPYDCDIRYGFYYCGWHWFDWMFDLHSSEKSLFLKIE